MDTREALEKEPAAQGRQEVMLGANEPARQSRQAVAALALLKVPAEQFAQDVLGVGEKVPARHAVHDVAPAKEKDPGAHDEHDEAFKLVEKVPGAHTGQLAERLVLENLPGGQGWHEMLRGEKKPAGQSRHVDELAVVMYVPTVQDVQAVAAPSENDPAVQARQFQLVEFARR